MRIDSWSFSRIHEFCGDALRFRSLVSLPEFVSCRGVPRRSTVNKPCRKFIVWRLADSQCAAQGLLRLVPDIQLNDAHAVERLAASGQYTLTIAASELLRQLVLSALRNLPYLQPQDYAEGWSMFYVDASGAWTPLEYTPLQHGAH